jgi:hypothetical protein
MNWVSFAPHAMSWTYANAKLLLVHMRTPAKHCRKAYLMLIGGGSQLNRQAKRSGHSLHGRTLQVVRQIRLNLAQRQHRKAQRWRSQ